jgi:DNA recombination protein RmuC
MEQALLIAVIVLLIVVCLLAVLAIVLLVKSRKPAGTNPLADPTYQALEKEIRDQGQANTTLLLNFQKMVNDSLTNNASLSNHSLTESIAALTTKVDDNLKDINEKVSQSLVSGFKGTSDTMGEIKERLGHIDETQKSLASLENQVVSLNTVLSGNQSRGAYGEMELSMLLSNLFPGGKGTLYDEQYVLRPGQGEDIIRPDAVLFFRSQKEVLCIDSKFPYSHYRPLVEKKDSLTGEESDALKKDFLQDLKNRIKEVSSKYIIPGITAKKAILFLPNDALLSFIHTDFPEVNDEALKANVVLLSPSLFAPFIYLFTALILEEKRSENLQEILTDLGKLSTEFARLSQRWDSLSNSIDSLKKNADNVAITVRKITGDFTALTNPTDTKPALSEPTDSL